ncbi:MAG: long-chain fatty acid--CoA ligase, partial [Desulfobacula sp.]|nr:long-chain fatty acid--CoA ligase [Desulfobacula sp.]
MEGKIKTTSNIVTQNALQNPEAPCVMFYDEIVTYKDMDQRTDAFANFLL